MVFHENSNCVVMNDVHFNQPVTLNAGEVNGLSLKEQILGQVKAGDYSDLELALKAVEAMALEGRFKPQKNYMAAYRLIEEFYAPGMETAEFCRLMEKKTTLTPELMPKNDNIRKIYFEKKNRYPNWTFPNEGIEWTQDITDLATELLNRIKSRS